MAHREMGGGLAAAIADLEEGKALALVSKRLDAGEDPLLVIKDCQEGLRQVGLRYEKQEYYLAGLIMGGEIFYQVMDMVQPIVKSQTSGQVSGIILLGTVAGDILDLGKNIVHMLLRCDDFLVHDLGVDVPPTTFSEQAVQLQPHVVGLSGLLTSAYDTMRETVSTLRSAGCQAPIIIGGGQLSAEVCQYVGADSWTTDAVEGVDWCRRQIRGNAG